MFFYLSKILLFIIRPMVWVFVLLFSALFTKDDYKRKKRLWIATILLFLLSNNFLVNQVFLWYEDEGTAQLDSTYEVGIVLGGFSTKDKSLDRTIFFEANDRLMQALRLYHEGRIKRILISSGSAAVIGDKTKEADAVADYLKSIHFPDSAVIIENQSRNTIENFKYSFQILDSLKLGNKKNLVISSAWHIPRAKLCIKDRNIDFYATNYLSDKKEDYSPMNLLVPSAKALLNMELLIKELVGYATYFVKVG
jgi:uncharacterized SAM-binding protein YcdF (DUF218 family)